MIREKAVLRSVASIATEIAQNSYDVPGENADQYLDEAESKIFEIAERRVTPVVRLDARS